MCNCCITTCDSKSSAEARAPAVGRERTATAHAALCCQPTTPPTPTTPTTLSTECPGMGSRSIALLLALGIAGGFAQARYYGKDLGPLSQLHHGVRGRVYAVDSKTLFIQDFHYDGEGPAAYFYVGKSKSPDAAGATRLRDERGGAGALRRYRGEPVTISLSDGLTLKDIRWFSVWCDEYAVNFGDVSIPRDLDYPKPAKVGALRGIHGVSSDQIIVVDAQTLLITNFSYDGEAPDAKFWVGRGDQPSPQGIRIPDENGKEDPLRKYDKKTIVLTLPGDLTVFDIGHFGVWCEAFTVDFGHITLPRAQVSNVPPSLKMLGVSPQSKLNCEVLNEEFGFEVRWAIAGDSIVLQLVAKLDDGEYMSFGISGHPSRVQMVGGDVAVAWVDKDSFMGYSKDYYLDAKSQCAGVRGTCPDERIVSKTNSVRVLNAALVNGYSIVTYQRSLRAADELDLPIFTNTSQPVIWAIGPLNSRLEASYHHTYLKEDKFIEFGRPPMWNCPMPESEDEGVPSVAPIAPGRQHTHEHTHKHREPARPESTAVIKPNPVPTPKPVAKVVPWEIPPIQCYEPSDGVFYAQMGPTGGKHGYSAITGHVGWGISWYINGLLIPEINVVRGKQYTFVVEGGSNPEIPAKYHPFYITNDPVGGYYHKSEEERKGIQIYAGARRLRSGEVTPTGVGRICNWTPDSQGPEADEYPSFGAYQRSLTLVCETGDPGVVTWTPDRNTPDTVYYQCFTHRHLGWKINVLDECDVEEAEESRVVESLALPDDLQSQESIQVQSRVAPDGNILDQRKKLEKIMHTKMNYNDFSSYKDGELTGEVYRDDRHRYKNGQEYELPISNNQIKEVIQTVESLESKMKDEIKKNVTHPQQVHQYQVHENVKEMFMPELPIREEDEYFVEAGKAPQNYLLPPNQKPLTLQSVLRPTGLNRVVGNMRPHFRRPAPPEIKLRRPPPMHHKVNPYPLPMPNPHNSHGMKKPSPSAQPNYKQPNNRPMPLNRPLLPNVPPMKTFSPPHINKPTFGQIHQHLLKNDPNPTQQTPLSIITANNKHGPNNMHLPVQTLSVGQSDIIVNQVVKSQITLPGSNDAIAQHSIPQPYHKSGQIILGKPMEHPVPLDQQMIQTKPHVTRRPSTPQPQFFQTSNPRVKLENELLPQNVMKSSDFIGESVDSSTLPPAMNTGFKPDSIVVESGFKPIIREPLMAGEDRIAEYDGNSNRREDTNVEEDYEESPQPVANHKVPSEKMTETFEPMFIPSPPDHLLPTNDRTKEVFPKNHAKEDRPHPVYVKKESELNALFGKKNMAKDVPTDMVMESNRVSPHYLPPDPKLPKEHSQKLSMNEQTFTTYDGKTVSADTLTSVPNLNKTTTKFSAKLPANSELLLKTPQFGPFKGEIPPPVAADIIKSSSSNFKSGSSDDVKTTHLKLVNLHKPEKSDVEDLVAHGSEKHEVTEDGEEFEEEEEYEDEEDEKRSKRDTKATHFEKGQAVEQKPTNGHSLPMNQIDYESVPSSGYKMRLQCISILVVLIATRIIRF
ncbi:protein Skeletor, isoforms D/E isoform X2 [Bombyx mandarina]|uniref:Protein Skeletor, isoforms D/E isoform X2 n=1 Tax=Bombyx mandarina TaxID=7092 RepID=A0A6J2JGG0_BOMMA|nr:protein Skeletor, isoforms D/E isoform X2 [Bombyx mandarina]